MSSGTIVRVVCACAVGEVARTVRWVDPSELPCACPTCGKTMSEKWRGSEQDLQAVAREWIKVRHENPEGEPRCPECGELWPCRNEVSFLWGISRGRELARIHGW